jgi:hypothetical protein
VNEPRPRSGNHTAAAVAVGASTKFQNLSGTSASFRQQQPVVPHQDREFLDRKAVVSHMMGAGAAARRIEEGTAGLIRSAYY